GLYHVSIPMTHPDCKAITLNVGTPTSPNPVHGSWSSLTSDSRMQLGGALEGAKELQWCGPPDAKRHGIANPVSEADVCGPSITVRLTASTNADGQRQRRPIRRRLINVPSVPAPLVEYDRESSPDGASNELRIKGSASPNRDGRDSSNLRGLRECLPVKHRSKDRLAEEPLPVSNVPRPRTAHFPTGDMLEELREEQASYPLIITSLSFKGLAGHTDRIQSRSVGRLERWEAIIARIKAPPKAAQCAPLPEEANLSCRWVIGGDSVASAVAEDMDLTELDRHFGIIADDDGEELHAPD
ncbi:hypothetical protein FOZ63_031096, partial [Perkinsus olseni]